MNIKFFKITILSMLVISQYTESKSLKTDVLDQMFLKLVREKVRRGYDGLSYISIKMCNKSDMHQMTQGKIDDYINTFNTLLSNKGQEIRIKFNEPKENDLHITLTQGSDEFLYPILSKTEQENNDHEREGKKNKEKIYKRFKRVVRGIICGKPSSEKEESATASICLFQSLYNYHIALNLDFAISEEQKGKKAHISFAKLPLNVKEENFFNTHRHSNTSNVTILGKFLYHEFRNYICSLYFQEVKSLLKEDIKKNLQKHSIEKSIKDIMKFVEQTYEKYEQIKNQGIILQENSDMINKLKGLCEKFEKK